MPAARRWLGDGQLVAASCDGGHDVVLADVAVCARRDTRQSRPVEGGSGDPRMRLEEAGAFWQAVLAGASGRPLLRVRIPVEWGGEAFATKLAWRAFGLVYGEDGEVRYVRGDRHDTWTRLPQTGG